MISKKLFDLIAMKKYNRTRMSEMLVKLSHLDELDAVDPIVYLLDDFSGNITQYHCGLISADTQKPLVHKLIKKYGIDDSVYSERYRFVNFLQDIQDAYDNAWDSNGTLPPLAEPMKHFFNRCTEIEKEYRL